MRANPLNKRTITPCRGGRRRGRRRGSTRPTPIYGSPRSPWRS